MIHLITAAITAGMISAIRVIMSSLPMTATAPGTATTTAGIHGIPDPTGTGTAVRTGIQTGDQKQCHIKRTLSAAGPGI